LGKKSIKEGWLAVEYYSSEIKSGLFIVIVFVSLLSFLFVVGDFSKSMGEKNILRIIAKNSEQIEKYASVSYAGFNIGEVADIKLSKEKEGYIELILELDPGVKIKSDSKFSIKSNNILGGKYIEMSPGSINGKELASGDAIYAEESFDMDRLLRGGDNMLQNSNSVLKNINAILTNPGVQKSIPLAIESSAGLINQWQEISSGFAKMLEDKNTRAVQSMEQLNKMMKNLVNASERVERMVGHVDTVVVDAKDMLNVLHKTADNIHNIVQDASPELNKSVLNISKTTQNFVKTSEKLDVTVQRTTKQIDSIAGEVINATREISESGQTVSKKAVAVMNAAEKTILDNAHNIFLATENIKGASQNMSRFTEKIWQKPHILIWKEPGIYQAKSSQSMGDSVWTKGRAGFYEEPR